MDVKQINQYAIEYGTAKGLIRSMAVAVTAEALNQKVKIPKEVYSLIENVQHRFISELSELESKHRED